MVEFEGIVKSWGNSLGIVVPREVAKSAKLKDQARVHVIIATGSRPLRSLFGVAARKITRSSQQLKDASRAELDE